MNIYRAGYAVEADAALVGIHRNESFRAKHHEEPLPRQRTTRAGWPVRRKYWARRRASQRPLAGAAAGPARAAWGLAVPSGGRLA